MRYVLPVLAVFAAAAWGVAGTHGASTREVDLPIRSAALAGEVHARVVLPLGYDTNPDRRYPVVYFLHGLPGTSVSYQGNGWVVDALDHAGPAILVMPQGARDRDADPEYLDWGDGRNWGAFIANELQRAVDARFRTIPRREGRALVGLSAGGYGATIVGLQHLSRFSVLESWSGYFRPTDPSGTRTLERGPDASAHALVPTLHSVLRARPTLLAFYVGRDDTRFRTDNRRLDAELRAARVPHHFALYPGGHDAGLWQRHARAWLALALSRLAAPSG